MLGATEKVTDIVAKSSVPFLPTVSDEAADLVEACGIPGFRDHLGAGERRIGFDVPQHRWARHHMAGRITRKDRSEIEPEAIHVHFLDPVAKTVQDHAPDNRMVCVQSIPGAAVIGIPGRDLVPGCSNWDCPVRGSTVWDRVVAFRGVIEHDVKNDFNVPHGAALSPCRETRQLAPSGS